MTYTLEADQARGRFTHRTLLDLAYRRRIPGTTPNQFARSAPWWTDAEREATFAEDGTLRLSLPYFLLALLGAFRLSSMYELTRQIREATHDDWRRAMRIAIAHEPDLADDIETLVSVARLEKMLCWESPTPVN